jgi:hypothetical protein
MLRTLRIQAVLVASLTVVAIARAEEPPPIPRTCSEPGTSSVPYPVVLEARAPSYLQPLWQARVAGQVIILVAINREGAVSFACLVQGINALADRYTAQAARAWRFAPSSLEARHARLSFTFTLEPAGEGGALGARDVIYRAPFAFTISARYGVPKGAT